MSLFGGKAKSTDQPKYTSIPIQTSVATLPIPVCYGTVMISGNMIDYLDFQRHNKSSSGGGKGGSSSGKGGGMVDYTATLLIGMAEGPISIASVAKDGVSFETLSAAGYALISGTVTQAPWSYLVTAHPSHALAYPGLAYLVAVNFDLGGTPQVPSQNMICETLLAGSASWASGTYPSADMALCIQDVLTNPRYGAQDFPASAINTGTLLSTAAAGTTGDASLQTWCRANGFGYSMALTSVESLSSVLERWLQASYCTAFWSGTSLKFVSFGDSAVAGNGVTFAPNLSIIYTLGADDFIGDSSDDPVQIARADPTDVANVLRVEVTSSDGFFSAYPVEARDQAAIEQYGQKVGDSVTAHEIVGAPQGLVIANLWLQRGLSVRNTYTFKLCCLFCLVEPMDLLQIPDPTMPSNLIVVRVIGVDEDDNRVLTITAENFPQGIASPTAYAAQTTSNSVLNKTALAGPINVPVIFEPPMSLSAQAQIWIGVSSSDPIWGGADIYLSSDNISYALVGSVTQSCRQGVLQTALSASAATHDTTNTVTIDLTESVGVLTSTTELNAMADQTLCWVDGEILSYTTAALSAASTYTVSDMFRGQYGTVATSHATGSQFVRLDDGIARFDLPDAYIGQTLYMKAVSRSIFGEPSSIAGATAYTFMPTGPYGGRLALNRPEQSGLNMIMGFV